MSDMSTDNLTVSQRIAAFELMNGNAPSKFELKAKRDVDTACHGTRPCQYGSSSQGRITRRRSAESSEQMKRLKALALSQFLNKSTPKETLLFPERELPPPRKINHQRRSTDFPERELPPPRRTLDFPERELPPPRKISISRSFDEGMKTPERFPYLHASLNQCIPSTPKATSIASSSVVKHAEPATRAAAIATLAAKGERTEQTSNSKSNFYEPALFSSPAFIKFAAGKRSCSVLSPKKTDKRRQTEFDKRSAEREHTWRVQELERRRVSRRSLGKKTFTVPKNDYANHGADIINTPLTQSTQKLANVINTSLSKSNELLKDKKNQNANTAEITEKEIGKKKQKKFKREKRSFTKALKKTSKFLSNLKNKTSEYLQGGRVIDFVTPEPEIIYWEVQNARAKKNANIPVQPIPEEYDLDCNAPHPLRETNLSDPDSFLRSSSSLVNENIGGGNRCLNDFKTVEGGEKTELTSVTNSANGRCSVGIYSDSSSFKDQYHISEDTNRDFSLSNEALSHAGTFAIQYSANVNDNDAPSAVIARDVQDLIQPYEPEKELRFDIDSEVFDDGQIQTTRSNELKRSLSKLSDDKKKKLKTVHYTDEVLGCDYLGPRPRIPVPRCLAGFLDLPDKSFNEFFEIVSNTTVENEQHMVNCIWSLQEHNFLSKEITNWLVRDGQKMETIRELYLQNFNFTDMDILAAFKELSGKLYLNGSVTFESRIYDAFAKRWCNMNLDMGFLSPSTVSSIIYSCMMLNNNYHINDNIFRPKIEKSEFIQKALLDAAKQLQEIHEDCKIPKHQQSLRFKSLSRINPAHRERIRIATKLSKAYSVPTIIIVYIDCILRDYFDAIKEKALPIPAKVASLLDAYALTGKMFEQKRPSNICRYRKKDCATTETFQKLTRQNDLLENEDVSDKSHSSIPYQANPVVELNPAYGELPAAPEPETIDGRPHFRKYNYEEYVKAIKNDKKIPWLKAGVLQFKKFSSKNCSLSSGSWKEAMFSVKNGRLDIYCMSKIHTDRDNVQTWFKHGSIYKTIELQNTITDMDVPKHLKTRKSCLLTFNRPEGSFYVLSLPTILEQNEWRHVLNFNAALNTSARLPHEQPMHEYGWGSLLKHEYSAESEGQVRVYTDNSIKISKWKVPRGWAQREKPLFIGLKIDEYGKLLSRLMGEMKEFQGIPALIEKKLLKNSKNFKTALENWDAKMAYMFEQYRIFKVYYGVLKDEFHYRNERNQLLTDI
ncbi:hypothetical protein SJAG_02248 [Schizosaccharomyces japonicus yFS275]|uniref:SEC7 domain-containing protein n=1 Tax=Schizosaccharomyces japonicus (strain yFS275 / FY16936) TaxID=402676 RepID=B6K1Y6_SCHJY|nr:hypothetical protein SJAG_02248 [Schizosaccharomyces japonicus yFS275]EEB07167.1 hypothetical protein SJAG_02248 [Schizosaccharomyces japonicus yFS275]